MKKVLIAAVASALAMAAVVATTGIAGSGDTKKKTSPPPTMSQAFKDMQKQRDDVLARVAKRLDISTTIRDFGYEPQTDAFAIY